MSGPDDVKVLKNDNASLWHARLAHVGCDKLKQMSEENIINRLLELGDFRVATVCKGCQLGKHILCLSKNLS